MGNQIISPKEQNKLCDRYRSIPPTTFYSSKEPRTRRENKFGLTETYQLFEGINAFKELKLSAAAGCSLCMLFQDALKLIIHSLDELLESRPELYKSGITLGRDLYSKLKICFGHLSSIELDARLVVHTDQFTTRTLEPDSYIVETEADSPANFALARSWLAECCKGHASCEDSLEFEPPTRLLDVTIPSEPGIVRLCSTSDLHTQGRVNYVALSHCWGLNRPPKTTKDNLQSQMQGFPEARLPQTFYDTVRVTRELGLRYLWIDSLCIVQDDRSDFETECARMNAVYANALCTIAASDARDAREGLFRPRTMKPIRPIYESDGFEPKLTVIMQPKFGRSWMDGLQGPLQSRAWALQERHLSPRIIHYTKKCLMWECRTARTSEHSRKMCLKYDTDGYYAPERSSHRFLDGGRSELKSKDPDLEFYQLHLSWYSAVQQYSHRRLSHPEDKLPALAGIAAEWKRIKPEDEYFAGLWKSDIFKGLAWFPNSGQHSIRRRLPESHAAWPPTSPFKGIPSWSWAAFDGAVAHFGEYWFKKHCHDSNGSLHLHSVSTTTVGQNPFGCVSGGEITLSGWSMVVTISESALLNYGGAPKRYNLHPDIRWAGNGTVYFDYDPFCLPETQVQLLQLGKGIPPVGGLNSVCGLALLQVQTEELAIQRDLYRRVGMFKLRCNHSFWKSRRVEDHYNTVKFG
ncbi:heterokaryon incompatibility protein-domain-containing protein [Xylogone sp. PMI_703]|nr:heterokaryon incompatibility protein-domain-containing protein [Xylogone sp. PMI_703]